MENDPEWGDPYFEQPKPKTNQVPFLSDSRNLINQLKRKPYKIPKINEMLLKLEGFKYATYLDLNMVYYHIQINEDAINLCTIIFPWGK